MGTLTVTDPTIVLAAEGDRIAIRRAGQTVRKVLVQDTNAVLLLGPVSFTAGLTSLALRHGVDLVLLTASGRYRGRLVGPQSSTGPLRAAQARFCADPARCLPVARAIVAGKVRNQRALALVAQRTRQTERLAAVLPRLRATVQRVAAETDLDRLRGLEGDAAARYFGCFSDLVTNPEFVFPKRTRRPPRDPLNALLSFGYTLLGVHAESAVLRAGLEPSLGVFHQVKEGHPALMLDLIEEFRPLVVDALALRLVNRRQLTPNDFDTLVPDHTDEILAGAEPEDLATDDADPKDDRPPVYLGPTGRKIFFREFARKLREEAVDPTTGNRRTYQDLLLLQAWQLARVFEGKSDTYHTIERL
jgi:CRISPR-associated protein Cas1